MARDFNGSSDYMSTTAFTGNQLPCTLESYAFWIYPDSVAQYKRVHHWGTAGNRYRTAEMDDGWGFVFNFDFSGGGGAWSVAKPSTGLWQHYLVTFDGSSTANDPIVYKNGVVDTLTERGAPSGTIKTGSTTAWFASDTGSSQFWDGRIAEYAKWDRVLTQAEATTLAGGYSPAFIPQGLVIYFPLTGQNTPEQDKVSGLSLTMSGPTKIAHPDNIRYPYGFGNNKKSVSGGNGISVSGEAL